MLISGLVPLRNCRVGNIETVNAQVNMTAEEAIEWVKSKVGQSIDVDYVYGAQCVDLAKAYYTFLGFYPVKGNGSDYTFNVLPPGYIRIQGAQPQKGDLLVYTGGGKGYGHVAIYESDYSHYHQNYGGNQYVMHITHIPYDGMTTVDYWGVIRPDFKNGTSIKGYLDVCLADEGAIYVAGWAADFFNKNTNLDIYVYIGGTAETEGQATTEKHHVLANAQREDVDKAYPGLGANHGYAISLPTGLTGEQTVYVYAVNSSISGEKFLLGSSTLNIPEKETVPEELPKEDESEDGTLNDDATGDSDAEEPSSEQETETESSTESPTEAPTEAPTEPSTEAPTEAPTEPPTEAPTEAPTEPPTEAPTEPSTEEPTEKPTTPPTEAPMEETTESEDGLITDEETKETESETEKVLGSVQKRMVAIKTIHHYML